MKTLGFSCLSIFIFIAIAIASAIVVCTQIKIAFFGIILCFNLLHEKTFHLTYKHLLFFNLVEYAKERAILIFQKHKFLNFLLIVPHARALEIARNAQFSKWSTNIAKASLVNNRC